MATRLRNIGGDPNDPAWRYKMPMLQTKVEGRGNGIKTRLVNVQEVARSLKRPPTYPTKFFGCELGTVSRQVEKNNLFVINGSHDAATMSKLLDLFIEKYVLCSKCSLPETDLYVKNGEIFAKCNACGNRCSADNHHKLATFILKNPPDNTKQTVTAGQDRNAAERRDHNDGLDTSHLAGNDEDDEDIEWSVDSSREAAAARASDLSDAAKALAITDADNDTVIEEIRDILDGTTTVPAKIKAVRRVQKAGKIGNERRTALLFEAFFCEKPKLMATKIASSAQILQEFLKHPRCQLAFLGCLAHLVSEDQTALLPHLPSLLQAFFEADVVEEANLVAWFDLPTSKYVGVANWKKVQASAKPFIDWLKEADEEESDDEEEESDDEESDDEE
eukprot:TRINITY_DN1185_c0_g1_i1.p1 TRINITY_DN1185_c0_g1~~TRINITY_DN1185_c0_g1_i1.p1  ORF type:complete len:422 (-),score=136.35 TRINITY_DN1185_c0_g1_i1:263-1432(-)